MRIYVDPTVLRWIRRTFKTIRVATGTKRQRELLRLVELALLSDDQGVYFDVAEMDDDTATWLAATLVEKGRTQTYQTAYRRIAKEIVSELEKSVIDKLGDVAVPPKPKKVKLHRKTAREKMMARKRREREERDAS